MSILVLSYSDGFVELKRSPIFTAGTVVYSFTHSMTSTLGTTNWSLALPIKRTGHTETGMVYLCYAPDEMLLVVPERTCKLIADSPTVSWILQGLPTIIAAEFQFWSHLTTPVNCINSSNFNANLSVLPLSKFQFKVLLKPWGIEDV